MEEEEEEEDEESLISDDGTDVFNIAKDMTGNKPNDSFNILNMNARSLCPKMNSFVDTFKEMEA